MSTPAPDVALCRVLLFTPGNRPDRFAKAAATGADGLILDLEDAVSAAGNDEARTILIEHFRAGHRRGLAPGQVCGLRVNNIHTAAGVRDLDALVTAGVVPDFILLPKVESAFEVRVYTRLLAGIPLVCTIESARGLEAATEIANADPSVRALAFGGVDLAADLRAELAWEPLLWGRARIVQAAATAGIAAIDVPHVVMDDEAGLRSMRRAPIWATRRSSRSILGRCRRSSRSSRRRPPSSSARAASWRPARRRAGTWSSTRAR
jgi:citrate lyase beta subunit